MTGISSFLVFLWINYLKIQILFWLYRISIFFCGPDLQNPSLRIRIWVGPMWWVMSNNMNEQWCEDNSMVPHDDDVDLGDPTINAKVHSEVNVEGWPWFVHHYPNTQLGLWGLIILSHASVGDMRNNGEDWYFGVVNNNCGFGVVRWLYRWFLQWGWWLLSQSSWSCNLWSGSTLHYPVPDICSLAQPQSEERSNTKRQKTDAPLPPHRPRGWDEVTAWSNSNDVPPPWHWIRTLLRFLRVIHGRVWMINRGKWRNPSRWESLSKGMVVFSVQCVDRYPSNLFVKYMHWFFSFTLLIVHMHAALVGRELGFPSPLSCFPIPC